MTNMKIMTPIGFDSLLSAFRSDVISGFSAKRRTLPSRWLYDQSGSALFEEITQLPEYYVTRTEVAILNKYASEIGKLVQPGSTLVEFGSGASKKTELILSQIEAASYIPIDISREFLIESANRLAGNFPHLPIHPLARDFMRPLLLPRHGGRRCLGFFPGSTIGNLSPRNAVQLLSTMKETLGPSGQLLIGIDRIKDQSILLPAYDDAQGVTAQFNLNILHRINRELDGTIPVHLFSHEARWNDAEARIEMHLRANEDVTFVAANRSFRIAPGETIHTENSKKYGRRDARLLLQAGGWTPVAEWTDSDDAFAVILAEVTSQRPEP